MCKCQNMDEEKVRLRQEAEQGNVEVTCDPAVESAGASLQEAAERGHTQATRVQECKYCGCFPCGCGG